MHQYTTLSCIGLAIMFGVFASVSTTNPVVIVASAIAGVFLVAQSFFWDRPAPLWLVAASIGTAAVAWTLGVTSTDGPSTALVLGAAVCIPLSMMTGRKWTALGAAAAVSLVPVLVVALVNPDLRWQGFVVSLLLAYLVGSFVFFLNRYAWNLYLQIDAARRTSAELAVAEERFRFAADLHDIQGHTLHVIRLKTQLADRLIDSNPDAAHEQLREARELIAETLANTRNLAFGERHVALASELANARELFSAAGIETVVAGSPGAGPGDDLLGLAMREATTNILRHAQATRVSVDIDGSTLRITNDGSPPRHGPLSGLATLGERFESAGGSLRTTNADGLFTTEAVAR